MAEETSAQAALTRLELAFDRLDAAARRIAQRDGGAALEARHRQLQQEVEAAVAGLDRLIAAADAG